VLKERVGLRSCLLDTKRNLVSKNSVVVLPCFPRVEIDTRRSDSRKFLEREHRLARVLT
jgi:hypothetical protein